MTKDSKDIAIKVTDVEKTFNLPHEKHSGLKQLLINTLNGKHEKGYTKQHVLRGVSFEVEKGDFFGVVGRNGSGKSTMLKILAGIYQPDKGVVQVNGSLVPFIELGVGFNPELTGRENVFMNGALLGFSRKQMSEMYDDIVSFAELHGFMDQKLKNYSSGMQVRLAFSIAIRAESDILVLDEVLAVGDEAFQRKCYQYFAELKKNKKTVILVTHDMDSVQRFCNKAIMIEKGEIVEAGNPARVSQRYSQLFIKEEEKAVKKEDGSTENKNVDAKVEFSREDDKFVFDITIKPKSNIEDAAVVFLINKSNGERIYRWATDLNDLGGVKINEDFRLHLELEDIFPVGDFYAGISIVNKDRTKDFAVFDNLIDFKKFLPLGAHKYDINWKPKEEFTIENI